MERVNRIIRNEQYQAYLEEIRTCEKDRIFCHHDMSHFMDVARIACLLCMEDNISISKERIYAAALLHDIGRHMQYREGIPHEQASARLAPEILSACAFEEEEICEIVEAIASHRDVSIKDRRDLVGVIYRADKLSRGCYGCAVEKECNWKQEKKNLVITW